MDAADGLGLPGEHRLEWRQVGTPQSRRAVGLLGSGHRLADHLAVVPADGGEDAIEGLGEAGLQTLALVRTGRRLGRAHRHPLQHHQEQHLAGDRRQPADLLGGERLVFALVDGEEDRGEALTLQRGQMLVAPLRSSAASAATASSVSCR